MTDEEFELRKEILKLKCDSLRSRLSFVEKIEEHKKYEEQQRRSLIIFKTLCFVLLSIVMLLFYV